MSRAAKCLSSLVAVLFCALPSTGAVVDFQREIRPILSQNCFLCHGPDEQERKGGLRLDVREDALKPAKSGAWAIVPGKPGESELIKRIVHTDLDERMPPSKSGKKLSQAEVDLLRRWVAEGAPYAKHWAYEKVVRPALPEVKHKEWVRNGLDYFIVDRLEKEGLEPTPQADKQTLIRRVSLDLTGLPPTPEEVSAFVQDSRPDAYEALVDRLLDRESFGEHWARMWLDLARYADSAGYADDPLRTIWAYRDYVIDAFNKNKPFDQFTIEQIAGDLLPNPTEEQIVATAFHRNTMTNNEGGTNDEEFRSAAVVDRVNTTMAVWMGTSIACAQCHTHKYDPITQEEYFQFYAILNNTEDADRPDESPTLKLFTKSQKKQRAAWEADIKMIEKKLSTSTAELQKAYDQWQAGFPLALDWQALKPSKGTFKRESSAEIKEEGSFVANDGPATETYSIEVPLQTNAISALQVKVAREGKSSLDDGLITRVSALVIPPKQTVGGRFVRIEIPGKDKILSLAEVQVFSGRENVAPSGEATQSSTQLDAPAKLAIDGNTDGNFTAKSVTHTSTSENPWWELDLKSVTEVARVVIWNRTDNSLQKRLSNFRIAILDEKRQPVWEREIKDAPNPNLSLTADGTRTIRFAGAYASSSRDGTEAANVLSESKSGWAPADAAGELTLIAEATILPESGAKLSVTIERQARADDKATVRLAASGNVELPKYARTPSALLASLARGTKARSEEQEKKLSEYYIREVAPELEPERKQMAKLKKQLSDMPPYTVPVLHELAGDKRRKTHLQYRGNFMDLGKEVHEAVPAVFPPLNKDEAARLALAKWLVDRDNPLTARVMANRFWEQIFGTGIVRTAEEFGAQGELPSHPELLDWLAAEFMAKGWNVKGFLKMLVTSAAYRQSSKVTPELAERDPDNRLLARGPRVRLPAEAVRDQALFIGGLLSSKIKGPSVRPMRPSSGLSAAFGSSVDWKMSEGGDRYRRGLYTEWRRTSPYPSMSTFDAPNREVCTIRRNRTNTPLQALVTLNDPVYLEAAHGLARRMMREGSSVGDRIRSGFEWCLARQPNDREINRLSVLFGEALSEYAKSGEKAKQLTSTGDEAGSDVAEFAAWTTVANVLLNLDETLMKR